MIVRRDGELDTPSERSVVAIGVFDGLHRGHRAVIAQLLEVARQLRGGRDGGHVRPAPRERARS